MSTSYDTIVVGLGAAGVTAAATLAQAGRRVLALEADDRVGGRVRTVPFGDGVVELGAEWIHGTVQSRVYDCAVENVSIVEQDLTSEVFTSDGKIRDKALLDTLKRICRNSMGQLPDEPQPVGQHITTVLKNYLRENHPDVLEDQDFVTNFLELMNLVVDNYMASDDWNDVTTHGAFEMLDGHGYASWHTHGYRTFFEILLNTYNNGPGLPSLDIKLSKEVAQIKWPQQSAGDVEVVCADGDSFTADNVIVTVSLGVLKERYSSLFTPALPNEKIKMIQTISIGVMDKIILEFEQPWWAGVPSTFVYFLWTGEDREKVSKEDYWTTQILGCSTPMGSKNALTLWTSGEIGKMVETLPEDVVRTKCMELLRKFMGAKFTISEPTGIVRSTWYSNPFTRGSYSFDNVQMPQVPNARAILGEPLLDSNGTPRVLFAGEATDLTHYSTVHGASDSGYREARRLLD